MNTILRQVRRGILLGIGMAVLGELVFAAAPPSDGEAIEEVQVSKSQINQAMQGVALHQEKQSAAYWALSRPYSEYLLHQQDFGVQGDTASVGRDFPVYSGAPMLSNYNASYFEAKPMSMPSAGQIRILRLASGAVLLVLFSLPFIVLFKKLAEPDKGRRIQVFPIFTVRSGEYGSRELFAMAFTGGKMAHTGH